jgi:hypothetical protein
MRYGLFGSLALALAAAPAAAADPAAELVEKYLSSGKLAKGEQALERALAADPRDAELQFGLGLVRFARGVERLGQSLYEYGARSEDANVPFLRLPVPRNPRPNDIYYPTFRRILDDFRRDLAAAEEPLAAIRDEQVKLPVRLARVRMDLDGDGEPTDRLLDVMRKLMRQDFEFLKDNPEFLVCFDRADVAWLRAYCHLLMGMIDFWLAFDTESDFGEWAGRVFPSVKSKKARPPERGAARTRYAVAEPARLGRFRRHLLKVCELNYETWRYARAETDDDHEWLPNPKQRGVLGLPVRDEMIDAWLAAVAELEGLLDGRKVLPALAGDALRGVSIRKVLDDPPAEFDLDGILERGAAARYRDEGKEFDIGALLRVGRVFNDTTMVAYAAWFN